MRCLEYSQYRELLFSGGWDSKVNAWDPRSNGDRVAGLTLPGKVCSADRKTTHISHIRQAAAAAVAAAAAAAAAAVPSSSPPSPPPPHTQVFSMSVTDSRLVVATADRRVVSYDLRMLDAPEFDRESSLK